MGVPVRKDEQIFTYKDYLDWPDEERWELIDGIPYDMSPAPSPEHQFIISRLIARFQNFVDDKNIPCRVAPAPFDVRLPEGDQADEQTLTVVQPDISIVCDPGKIDGRGCKGAPDLVVEIVSPSTAKRDIESKFDLYQRAGVPEYWIIHPGEKYLIVYKLDKNKEYYRAGVYSAQETVSLKIKEELQIQLSRIFETG